MKSKSLIAVLAVLTIVAAACGNGDDDAGPAPVATTAAPATTAAAPATTAAAPATTAAAPAAAAAPAVVGLDIDAILGADLGSCAAAPS
ncbi:MAG: azurin, partial [Actinobacteria bacterium]|nr:azurin [Actinomycetota bacterium]